MAGQYHLRRIDAIAERVRLWIIWWKEILVVTEREK